MIADKVLHYTITGRLGTGGMGQVYEAVDTRLDRKVALKFLHPVALQETEARERLRFEAQAAARLDHPNIGIVYAIEETDDGQLFIVLAYYEGLTLRQRLEQGPLPWREAATLALHVARGLEHAHRAQLVHRDIKPGNLLITPEGKVKILDFGLAQARQQADGSQMNAIAGTMAYMAPEQVRGQAVDDRADLWALGVVLYQMLTGVSPFKGKGDVAATILKIIKHEPASLLELHPECPAALDVLLAKALAKDPALRYGSAQQLGQDLDALTDEPRPSAVGNVQVAVSVTESSATLPVLKSPLVGRQDELTLINTYLADDACRMLTLLGTGGTGKTRLALETAHAHHKRRQFGDGVYFSPLDALDDIKFVPTSVAEALNLNLTGQEKPIVQISQFIGQKHMLLVLDNFEHVIEAALLPSQLLQNCPNLKLLVTSRERLNIEEEWTLPLAGLSVPDGETSDMNQLASSAAVELFMQRAQRVTPDFALTEDSAPGVIRICQLVKGLPLGLELAAVWVRLMSPEMIANEIQKNYDFLVTRSRNTTVRHRSIRAVFDYSWQLLDDIEQETLRKLSVFRGSISQEAYEQVVAAPLNILASLVDKSLLVVSSQGRYQQHSVLLPYASDKLRAQAEEHDLMRAAHGSYFLGLVSADMTQEAAHPKGEQMGQRTLDLELENIRVAWRWALEGERWTVLKRSVRPLLKLYERRGLIQEGSDVFLEARDYLADLATKKDDLIGHLQVNSSFLRMLAGDYSGAEELATRGLNILRPLEETDGIIIGLNVLGALRTRTGKFQDAEPFLREALSMAQAQRDLHTVASLLSNLGNIKQVLGAYEDSRTLFEQSLELSRQLGNDSQIVLNLNNLGSLALSAKRLDGAEPLLNEGLALARDSGMQRLIPFFLANLGTVAYKLGDFERSHELGSEALEHVRESGERWFEAALLIHLGKTATARQLHKEAVAFLKGGLKLAWTLQDLPLVLQTLVHFSDLWMCQKRARPARIALDLVRHHEATNKEDRDLAAQLIAKLPSPMLKERPYSLEEVVERLL